MRCFYIHSQITKLYGSENMGTQTLNCSRKPNFRINDKNAKKNVPQDLGKFWDKIVKQC